MELEDTNSRADTMTPPALTGLPRECYSNGQRPRRYGYPQVSASVGQLAGRRLQHLRGAGLSEG